MVTRLCLLATISWIAEGFHFEISKSEIYFAMAFSLGMEILNLKIRSKRGATPTPN